jgi:hypothetical protein
MYALMWQLNCQRCSWRPAAAAAAAAAVAALDLASMLHVPATLLRQPSCIL